MKKIYTLITGGLLLLASYTQSTAQCPGNRYHDVLFPALPDSTMNVVYGSNANWMNSTTSLKMDIYQPHGDTDTLRALIIWAHGGSFIGGAKADMAMLCRDFSKLGYVTATMDYRLFMSGLIPGTGSVDSNSAGAAVMRAVHDARAAVRYFRKNFTEGGNTYGIDTNNIYFGGASAGGFIALHLAYMNELSEFPSYIDTTGTTNGWQYGQKGMHGGIEGISGNQGYSSNIKAIVNLSGAISDTAWMHTGDVPVISTHSIGDGTVPYGHAKIFLSGTYPIQYVDGSVVVTIRANEQGIINCFKSYTGSDHVPEGSDAGRYDTTITLVRDFLEHFTCGTPITCTSIPTVGVNELAADDASIKVFPNPAYNTTTIDLTAFSGKTVSLEMYDALGRKVNDISKIKADRYTITRGSLPNGIYMINVIADGKLFSKKIIFE